MKQKKGKPHVKPKRKTARTRSTKISKLKAKVRILEKLLAKRVARKPARAKKITRRKAVRAIPKRRRATKPARAKLKRSKRIPKKSSYRVGDKFENNFKFETYFEPKLLLYDSTRRGEPTDNIFETVFLLKEKFIDYIMSYGDPESIETVGCYLKIEILSTKKTRGTEGEADTYERDTNFITIYNFMSPKDFDDLMEVAIRRVVEKYKIKAFADSAIFSAKNESTRASFQDVTPK